MLITRLLLASALLAQVPSAQESAPQDTAPQDTMPLRALVVGGANNHDWEWSNPEIGRVLAETGRFAVTLTDKPAQALVGAPERFKKGELDVIVLNYNGPRWGEAAERDFLQAVRDGCGVVVLHAANNSFTGWQEYEDLVGLLWRDGSGHGAYHPFDVNVVDPYHPITKGMADIRQHPDELYHRLVPGAHADFKVLMSAYSAPVTRGTGRFEPMVLVSQCGKGRMFHTTLGHVWRGVPQSRATWYSPQLRRLVARGAEWAASGVVTLAPEPLNYLTEEERTLGFQLLFDGRTLDNWRAFRGEGPPAKGWLVRDAALVNESGGGDLVTRQEYSDFDFRFSFRVAPKANSGVIWHVLETAAETYMTGPEYQVIDDFGAGPAPQHSVGALYDLVPPVEKTVRRAGAWNDGRIVVQNGRVQHWLNGNKVVDAPCSGPEWDKMVANSKFKSWPFGKSGRGRIALQDHGDPVAFRNLRIRQL
ncbi:MAG: DUF1080 domain-containing protein [Planctomycetes bacterium]|nr:DUF1080 domain-containing protein [Planctomycetota bacterium]